MEYYLDVALFCYAVLFDLLHMFFYRLNNTTPSQTQNTCMKRDYKRNESFQTEMVAPSLKDGKNEFSSFKMNLKAHQEKN